MTLLGAMRPTTLVVTGMIMACAGASSLDTRLSDGTPIQFDSNTNRVTVPGSGGRPLWDGVHTLQDGSTITIRSGVAVPNMPMVETQQWEQRGLREPQGSPGMDQAVEAETQCVRLVRKVCGSSGQCRDRPGCPAARQLLDMEHKEQGEPVSLVGMTHTSISCSEALTDEGFFGRCNKP